MRTAIDEICRKTKHAERQSIFQQPWRTVKDLQICSLTVLFFLHVHMFRCNWLLNCFCREQLQVVQNDCVCSDEFIALAVSTRLPARSQVVGRCFNPFNFGSVMRRHLTKTFLRIKRQIELKNCLRQTVSLNAPKAERISQPSSNQCSLKCTNPSQGLLRNPRGQYAEGVRSHCICLRGLSWKLAQENYGKLQSCVSNLCQGSQKRLTAIYPPCYMIAQQHPHLV